MLFRSIEANGRIELYWETVSEINNLGFYVERRQNTDEDNWSPVSNLITGAGNSKQINRYNFVDKSVIPNTTYQYRLRQMDMDGLQSCQYSKVITLAVAGNSDLSIDAISPNPIQQNTAKISFTIPKEDIVKLEVLDIFGNVVKTIINKWMPAGYYSDIEWNVADNSNLSVSNGGYICRLTAGKKVRTMKMSVVK